MSSQDALAALKAENARLIALLEAHGIEWRAPPAVDTPPATTGRSNLSAEEQVSLFRRLFRGRTDVYPVRWESKTTGKSGYAPACSNEWRAGVCEKPRIKCGDCGNRLLKPLSDSVLYDHLAGKHTVTKLIVDLRSRPTSSRSLYPPGGHSMGRSLPKIGRMPKNIRP